MHGPVTVFLLFCCVSPEGSHVRAYPSPPRQQSHNADSFRVPAYVPPCCCSSIPCAYSDFSFRLSCAFSISAMLSPLAHLPHPNMRPSVPSNWCLVNPRQLFVLPLITVILTMVLLLGTTMVMLTTFTALQLGKILIQPRPIPMATSRNPTSTKRILITMNPTPTATHSGPSTWWHRNRPRLFRTRWRRIIPLLFHHHRHHHRRSLSWI